MKNKTLLSLVLLITSISVITSCTKTTSAAPPTLVGYWIGNFENTATSTNYPSNPMSVLFRSNGTIRFWGLTYDTALAAASSLAGEGVYTLVKDTVKFHFLLGASSPYSCIAVINSSRSFMIGSIGNGTDSADLGMLYLTK